MTGVARPDAHVLREYAFVADGERGAVVGPDGGVAWLCFPAWHDGAVFSSLLGGHGAYTVCPTGRFVWGGYYEAGSLIWVSRWIVGDAIVESREALAFPGERDRAVLLRRVVGRLGAAQVQVTLAPRAGYDRRPVRRWTRGDDDRWRASSEDVHLAFASPVPLADVADGHGGRALVGTIDVEAGSCHDLVLELSTGEPGRPIDAGAAWRATEAAWRAEVPPFDDTASPRDASLAYAVMRGLTSSTGAMVAAATTSLPERVEQGRSYDYRYAWVRDQCFAGRAVGAHGAHPLLDAAARVVTGHLLEDGPGLRPAYTVGGGPVPPESRLDLPGYPGGLDVAGNHVRDQFQLDAFGEALVLLATAAGRDRLDADGWRAVEVAVDAVERRWAEPDNGVWELRPDRWAHSRLQCVAGLRAVARHAPSGAPADRWTSLADAIMASAARDCVHPSGRWQRSPTDPSVDAALLLPAVRGAIPADDPRSVGTYRAIVDELTDDGYVYRYRPDGRPLGDAEGAFLLCGFLMCLAARRHEGRAAAVRWFERNRSGCGPPGLFTEEFDVRQRQLRGNLPQAFVHALLLECATELG